MPVFATSLIFGEFSVPPFYLAFSTGIYQLDNTFPTLNSLLQNDIMASDSVTSFYHFKDIANTFRRMRR